MYSKEEEDLLLSDLLDLRDKTPDCSLATTIGTCIPWHLPLAMKHSLLCLWAEIKYNQREHNIVT